MEPDSPDNCIILQWPHCLCGFIYRYSISKSVIFNRVLYIMNHHQHPSSYIILHPGHPCHHQASPQFDLVNKLYIKYLKSIIIYFGHSLKKKHIFSTCISYFVSLWTKSNPPNPPIPPNTGLERKPPPRLDVLASPLTLPQRPRWVWKTGRISPSPKSPILGVLMGRSWGKKTNSVWFSLLWGEKTDVLVNFKDGGLFFCSPSEHVDLRKRDGKH